MIDMTIEEERKKIDKIDNKLIELLAKRLSIVKELGGYKRQNSLEIFDPEREKELILRMEKLARDKQLDPKFVRELMQLILRYSKQTQL